MGRLALGMGTWRARRKKPTRGRGVPTDKLGPDQTKPQGYVALVTFKPPLDGWPAEVLTKAISTAGGIAGHRKVQR